MEVVVPFLTADALTEDPEGLAFLRDVLAQPAAADAGKRELPATVSGRRSRRLSKHAQSEPTHSAVQPGGEPVEAAA
jgi:hypothetical protein